MAIKAIPTTYRGVEFRSRLEAKWAVMFDLLEWPWEYEPIDLDGYIPDFIIKWSHGHTLCEVKPATTTSELLEAVPKIEQSGWRGEALIVGASIGRGDTYPELGLVSARSDAAEQWEHPLVPNEPSWWWGSALIHHCAQCWSYSIHHEHAGWQCRACGAHDGDRFLMSIDVSGKWAQATNAVKYRHAKR
jgi:hypothetical protein